MQVGRFNEDEAFSPKKPSQSILISQSARSGKSSILSQEQENPVYLLSNQLTNTLTTEQKARRSSGREADIIIGLQSQEVGSHKTIDLDTISGHSNDIESFAPH